MVVNLLSVFTVNVQTFWKVYVMEMKIFIVCGVFEHFDKLEQMLTQLLKLLIERDQCDIYLSRSPA